MRLDDDSGTAGESNTERPLNYWRTLSALDFGQAEIAEGETCVGSISSTVKDWRDAVHGDAAAALTLSLRLRSMPLDGSHRNRLATSWLVRNLYLARDYSASRPPRARQMRGGRKS